MSKEEPVSVQVIRSSMQKVIDKSETEVKELQVQKFSEPQRKLLSSPTPARVIYERAPKGNGNNWRYVPNPWVIEMLNTIFDYAWSFDILEQMDKGEMEVIVKGQLTVQLPNGQTITKTDFGGDEHIKNKQGSVVSSWSNVAKGAASDCLRRCARQFGIALDVYNEDLGKYRDQKVIRDAEEQKEIAKSLSDKLTNKPEGKGDSDEVK